MTDKLALFISHIRREIPKEVISVIEFGSQKGEKDPTLSDIDILMLVKDRSSIGGVLGEIRKFEKEIFRTVHSTTNDFLERFFFGSEDFGGVHAVVLAKDELTQSFKPKSLRLRLLASLVFSRSLFLYSLKKEYRVLYGEDVIKSIPIPEPSFLDRARLFFGVFGLFVFFPFFSPRGEKFKVWCFKIVKDTSGFIEAYITMKTKQQILIKETIFNDPLIDIARQYRYQPESYRGSSFTLYLSVFLFLLKNTRFIFMSERDMVAI